MQTTVKKLGGWYRERRRGSIVVLAAVMMVVILAFTAFAVDVGYLLQTKTELQSIADSAALSAAMELSATDNEAIVRDNAWNAARDIAAMHKSGGQTSFSLNESQDIQFGRIDWNAATQTSVYQWGNEYTPYNIVKITARCDQRPTVNGTAGADQRLPLLFAPVMGYQKAVVNATSIASFQPRDFAVVLDFSASMNDDSTFAAISKLGQANVEANLNTMWGELGAPVYGNMGFTPAYAVLKGVALSGTIPHIDVTFKGTSIAATSTSNLTSVKLQFSNGNTQTFSSLSAKTGSFAGSGSNSGKTVTKAWVKSGGNSALSSGSLGELFTFDTTNLVKALGLNTVAYPYPSGSWTEYVNDVTSSGNSNSNAGYRWKFGAMSWIDFTQSKYPSAAQSPNLWMTSEQPVGLLKDGVDVFVDYLLDLETEDKVALSIYTHSNAAGAILEKGLTSDLPVIKDIVRHRQAGHYDAYTNISAGMKVGRDELVANARPKSARVMVLMTDGLPNRPT
ncbi:MAG: hypothetical protein HZA46_14640, partial [Planctomycetales bacterium]|nr:hypothetical protein [Planctomycetales bacterium]